MTNELINYYILYAAPHFDHATWIMFYLRLTITTTGWGEGSRLTFTKICSSYIKTAVVFLCSVWGSWRNIDNRIYIIIMIYVGQYVCCTLFVIIIRAHIVIIILCYCMRVLAWQPHQQTFYKMVLDYTHVASLCTS